MNNYIDGYHVNNKVIKIKIILWEMNKLDKIMNNLYNNINNILYQKMKNGRIIIIIINNLLNNIRNNQHNKLINN
jgi:hypothetical protein